MKKLSYIENSGKKLTNDKVLENILIRCKERNYAFNGFDTNDGLYHNVNTKLKLHCNICGNEWNTTSYAKFIYLNRGCPECSKVMTNHSSDVIDNIKNRCKKLDYEFLGFNNVTNTFNGSNTKLILKCNKCGTVWNTTNYSNFFKLGRCSHHCNRKNPTFKKITKDKKSERENKVINIIPKKFTFIKIVGNSVVLKCNECGSILTYSYRTIIKNKSDLKCKNCDAWNYVNNQKAINNVKAKCLKENCTFLGFDNDENVYKNKNTKLILKCNKCGNVWKTTSYASFIKNDIKCNKCVHSWKMEQKINDLLSHLKVKFTPQQRFNWLKSKISMSVDFYLPDLNIAIECQGKQHYEPVKSFGGEKSFNECRKRDIVKNKLCKKNNVRLVYFDDETKYEKFLGEKVIKNKQDLENILLNG